MKTQLTPADREKVWRLTDHSWPYYFWKNNCWMIAPCDPRTNPMLTNIAPATGQLIKGILTRTNGFVEVP